MSRLHRRTSILVLTLAFAVGVVAESAAEDWTQWGGPTRDFQAVSKNLAASWPESGPPKLWSRELGDGYSTILVAGERLYTMYRSDGKEAAVCLDAATGKTIWERRYEHEPWEGHIGQFGEGPRATPLIDGDRLYTIGVAGLMYSLNLKDGEVLWHQELWGDREGSRMQHGYSSSPISYGDKVIALAGGEQATITALDKKDGSIAWKSDPFENTYSAPQVLKIDGQDQLVTFMGSDLVAVDPTSGELLWKYAITGANINMPVLVDGEYLFLSTLREGSRGLRLRRDDAGKTEVEEIWATRKIQFYHVTSVLQGDWVYGTTGARAPNFMAAVNVKTGEIAWRKRGFAKANLIAADGRLIILDEDGTLALATATPEDLTVHSQVQLLDGVAWTAPTLVGTTMYIRDKTQIMALDLGKQAEGKKEASS
jgi:outer membrane protein assembly factor BamB